MSRRKEYTIKELENKYLIKIDSGEKEPFGYMNNKWKAFKTKIRPGDKIVRCSDSKASWDNLAGSAGYYLVRDGEINESLITKIS